MFVPHVVGSGRDSLGEGEGIPVPPVQQVYAQCAIGVFNRMEAYCLGKSKSSVVAAEALTFSVVSNFI